MLGRILTKFAQKSYPSRSAGVEKVGKSCLTSAGDTIGCNDYLLEGQFTYDEVVALNKLTAFNVGVNHCGFGFCKELGPVAFIGLCNPNYCNTSGYFQYNVHEYGKLKDESEYYWNVYSDEDAKSVRNYTVYGLFGLKAVAAKAPIAKMQYIYDSRYKCKRKDGHNNEKTIIEMDLKLSGKYSFAKARLLSTGTTKDKTIFCGEECPIQFALVGDDQYVGIINLDESEDDFQFRDVWEFGSNEPKLQNIRFLSNEEAREVNNFDLYVYSCPYNLKTKEFPIEKRDRTFDSRFNFHLIGGKDYRLI